LSTLNIKNLKNNYFKIFHNYFYNYVEIKQFKIYNMRGEEVALRFRGLREPIAFEFE